MKWKKISFWIVLLLFLGGILDLGLGKWINNSLPAFINEKNDTPYNFNYSGVSYSLLKRKMVIEGISIFPKFKNIGIYNIKIKKITIHGVHFFTFFSKKDLIADLIEIDSPDIIINQKKNDKIKKKKIKTYDIGKSIQINNFILKDGKLQLFISENHKKIVSLNNLNINLSGVIWDIANTEKRIPITFKNEKLSVDNIFYQLNDLHYLKLAKIKTDNGNIEAEKIEIKSDITPEQFKQDNYLQKSLINIQVPAAEIKKLNWGYDSLGIFYVTSSKIEVDSTQILISSKNKISKNKITTSYIDRIIPFNLRIDTIQILKSKVNIENSLASDNINILMKNINNKLNDKITINELKLSNTNIKLYSPTHKISSKSQSRFTYYFDDILNIKKFSIENANIKYYNINKINVLKMDNINYTMNDIVINTLITNTTKKLPFTYSNYKLQANNIFYSTLKNYTFHLDKMMLANDAFIAHSLKIIPKISRISFTKQKLSKYLFKADIKTISIPKINWNTDNNDFFIQAPTIIIDNMYAILIHNKNSKSISKKLQLNNSDLGLNLHINAFVIKNSNIVQYDALKNTLLFYSKNVNVTVNDIIFNNNSENITLSIPFSFSRFHLTANSIYYNLGYHSLYIGYIDFKNNSINLSNLKMSPINSQKIFMKKRGIDAYTISLDKLDIPNLDLGLPNNEIKFTAPLITFYRLYTNIHQYDIPKDEYIAVYKPLFNKKLHDLKFKLFLGQINLIKSYLSYEEESLDKGTGKIFFSDIKATIKNVASGYKVNSLPDVSVDFKSKFMDSAQLSALWKFNVMNTQGNFSVLGTIKHLPAQKLNMFIKPYLHVSADGIIDQTLFNFNGNENTGNGSFGMEYKDLKISIYKNNGKEEKKLLSSLANLAVKDNNGDSLKIYTIKEQTRSKDKSFFNFLWKMTLSGLKEALFIF